MKKFFSHLLSDRAPIRVRACRRHSGVKIRMNEPVPQLNMGKNTLYI
jgi:hypothetical protein